MKLPLAMILQLGTLVVTLSLAYSSLKTADTELRTSLAALKELQEAQVSFMRSWDAELAVRIHALELREAK